MDPPGAREFGAAGLLIAILLRTGYSRIVKALLATEEQFLTDAKGKRVGVLVDLKTYARLREAEEELADIRTYDIARPKVHAELEAGQFITVAEYQIKRMGRRK